MNEEEHVSGLCRDDNAVPMAVANLTHTIELSCRFPQNVFSLGWREFLFFDSDLVFNPEFARNVRTLLEIEGSACVCLANLFKMARGIELERCCLFLDSKITNDKYLSFLRGSDPAAGLIYDAADPFGCTSDIGQWTIYCDRGSDIAVIAFRDQEHLLKFAPVTVSLGALPINEALERSIGYGFSPAHIAHSASQQERWLEWSTALRKAYEKRSEE